MLQDGFFSGTLILMLSSLIVRSFGFVYRIYLSNLIGAEGMGLFQLISPIYSLVILTLTSGISISVSRMVAAQKAFGNVLNIRRITRYAFVLVTFLGVLVAIFMYFGLNFIVSNILKDDRTYLSMLLLIPCIPVISASSALKGYFYGMTQMLPTAITQVLEQIVKISIVLIFAAGFLRMGIEYACAVSIVGMAAGEVTNLIVLLCIYFFKKKDRRNNQTNFEVKIDKINKINEIKQEIPKKEILKGESHKQEVVLNTKDIRLESKTKNEKAENNHKMKKREIFRRLIYMSAPISMNRFITSLMGAFEMILIPQRLLAGGLDYTASMQEFGRMAGMAMPLIFFPSLVTSSLATTLVPVIAEAQATNSKKTLCYRISKAITTTSAMGFIFMALFLSFPTEIGSLLYSKEKIGPMLYSLAFTCVFLYLQQVFLGILNGLGMQGISLINSSIGYIIRIIAVWFFIPDYGMNGYIISITISGGVVCILNLIFIIKATSMSLEIGKWLIKPGIICVGLVLASPCLTYGAAFLKKLVIIEMSLFSALSDKLFMTLEIIIFIIISLIVMSVIGILDMSQFTKLIPSKIVKER